MSKSSIGQFISVLRKANGMTQKQVAARLNVSDKAVSRWERDECAPDISVIPALAEMFGITCDELLKGERNSSSPPQENKEIAVEKQIKNLINRTLSGFKTLIWISLAVSVIGLVCMFGISYGLYRPVIGFAVMLLFEICAFAISVLAVIRTKDVKRDNELFAKANKLSVTNFNNTLGTFSFTAFFLIVAVILISLPLILVTDSYIESVLSIKSYLTLFFGGIVLILALIFLKFKKPYIDLIADKPLFKELVTPIKQKVRLMTVIQVALTLLAGLIFILAPYFETSAADGFSFFDVAIIIGLACLAASIIFFIVFLIKQKENRRKLLLSGLRNICLIPSALIISEMHYMGWRGVSENEYIISQVERYDVWQTEYLWLAIAFSLLVTVIFSLIQALIERKAN